MMREGCRALLIDVRGDEVDGVTPSWLAWVSAILPRPMIATPGLDEPMRRPPKR
jgi:hypothetical protein